MSQDFCLSNFLIINYLFKENYKIPLASFPLRNVSAIDFKSTTSSSSFSKAIKN